MSTKKKLGLIIGVLLLLAGIIDTVRYLKPDATNKQVVLPQNSFPPASANEIILVYNAWGGIYAGIVDFINKEAFPASYPCNLCYQTFGTFSMKEEWRKYLDSLPLKKTELHKDNFQRLYKPEHLQLPIILISNGKQVQLLLSSLELNQYKPLDALQKAVGQKLQR